MPSIQRAIIIAAGEGRRLRPITRTIPKPLIPVNGTPFIDTIIAALHANGIEEIHVVTGYLAEQYDALPQRYRGITLIHNPYYATCNNISSAYVARAHLENAMVLEADLLINNPAVCARDFVRSCYCAFAGTSPGEWALTLDGDGTVADCQKAGGAGDHQLIGISLWTAEDGRKLRKHLERAFEQERMRDVYWDELALFLYRDDYALGIRPIEEGDVVEIDTLQELAAADRRYETYLHQPA